MIQNLDVKLYQNTEETVLPFRGQIYFFAIAFFTIVFKIFVNCNVKICSVMQYIFIIFSVMCLFGNVQLVLHIFTCLV